MTTNNIDADVAAMRRELNRMYAADVAKLRAERDDLANLLDQTSQARDRFRRERDEVNAELDKVREQLADTHNRAHTDATNLQQILRDKTALANENARLRRQLAEIACLKCWTNEDGKRFVFVTDIQTALGVPTDKAVAR